MNGSDIQLLPELYAPAEQLPASMPVPMEGRGTLLYESLRALLPVVLSVGVAAMAWLMKWRYRSLIFAIGNNVLGNPVSAPGQEQKAGKLSTRSAWARQ